MLRSSLRAFLLAALVLPAPAIAGQNCALNTGLDPACPLTAIGVSQSTQVLDANATQHGDTLFGSLDLHGDAQVNLALPIYQHLAIAGVGDAYGVGDLYAGFSRVIVRRKRIAHVLGLAATFPTGAANFSAERAQVVPEYALSYALGSRISLVGIASYALPAGGTKLPYAPRVQRFRFVPRAIVELSKAGLYAAADIDGRNVTGDQRYQEYAADGTLGLVGHRYALSFTYRAAIATFTWHNIFEHDVIGTFSIRP